MKIEQLARVCHEANRAYCASIGDDSQQPWESAPEWQRVSAINGVVFHIASPEAPASATHDAWVVEKLVNGWKFGKVKDADAKTHPCIVTFDRLPIEQQRKDVLFRAIVHALYTPTPHAGGTDA